MCSSDLLANRGASGIDGLLSSALGAAAGTNKTVCLMLGDLSCLYDINALMMAENCERPFKIILLNNHGGAIFSTLYMAESDYRERFFNTPQHVDFEKIVSGFGVSYTRLELKGDYMKTFRSYFLDEQTRFIEVRF